MRRLKRLALLLLKNHRSCRVDDISGKDASLYKLSCGILNCSYVMSTIFFCPKLNQFVPHTCIVQLVLDSMNLDRTRTFQVLI